MPRKKKPFPYPLLTPLYELEVIGIQNKKYFVQDYNTSQLYLTYEEAVKKARETADSIAWSENIPGCDDKTVFLVRVRYGRKFSRKETIYGFSKVVYGISTGTKEMTDEITPDPTIKAFRIDEYTEQPHLTEDMFYQWDNS